MKLRVRGNSIRLRLSQDEVQKVGRGESVEELTGFPGGSKLRYALIPTNNENPRAFCLENSVIVEIPNQMAETWASSKVVEIKFELPLNSTGDSYIESTGEFGRDSSEQLFVLIEKDFQCLKTRTNENEDESGLFPNPNHAKGHC